jgi:hypothetical protein
MDQDDFMSQIEVDFDVQCYAHRPGRALFAAVRRQTWHLVIATFDLDAQKKMNVKRMY